MRHDKNMKQKSNLLYGVLLGLVLLVAAYGVTVYVQDKPVGMGGSEFSFNASTVTTASTSTPSGGNSVVVLASNPARGYALITNTGGTIAYLALNDSATSTTLSDASYTIPLAANGGTYEINSENLYKGRIIATSSAAVNIRAVEAY